MPEPEKIVTNYANNSHNARSAEPEKTAPTERPKLEQVTTGEVIKKKTPLGRKLVRAFTGDDVHNVGHYLVVDVLLPAARNTIVDLVTQGVERTIYGEARPRSSSSGGMRTNYDQFSRSSPIRREDPRPPASRSRSSRDFGVVILKNREEAEHVIDQLVETIERFRWATVADLYDLVGQSGNYTDRDWGWDNLRDARIERVREGYLVDLPRPVHID